MITTILVGLVLILTTLSVALYSSNKSNKVKNEEIRKVLSSTKDGIKKMIDAGIFDSALNVDKFNDWFNRPGKEVYAHAGIFLRLDKLCTGNIEDYLKEVLGGIVTYKDLPYSKITKFEDQIRKDWRKRLDAKCKV